MVAPEGGFEGPTVVWIVKGATECRRRIVVPIIPRHVRRHVDSVVMRTHAVAIIQEAGRDHAVKVLEIIHVDDAGRVVRIGGRGPHGRKRAADDDDVGKKFYIGVYLADQNANNELSKIRAEWEENDNYPGLCELPKGAEKIDEVYVIGKNP